MEALNRLTRTLAFTGILAKSAFFFLLFLWARDSEIGSAALRGAVWAAVFTWIVFSFVEYQFRRFQVTLGVVFEIALIILYFNRGAWFDISTETVAFAMSGLWFMLFTVVKAGVWGAELTLEVTGVKETASP